MFTIHNEYCKKDGSAKGFQMTFENGNTISVMFGEGNYCSKSTFKDGATKSNSAEIAIWNKEGNWFDFGDNTVKGWCTPDEVATFIQLASTTII